uniref:Si:ch211-196f5.2 n=2 Tax=Oncorhynchus mykiss TaxID=8022 RepID=A0A8C7NL84_ONCMY
YWIDTEKSNQKQTTITERREKETNHTSEAQETQTNGEQHSPKDSPILGNMVRTELEWDVPMSVPLPIEVISADQPFPFLDTTLADLGIEESAVKERVVWVDTKRTQVKSKSGKLKEKEITILEVRVKAQIPGDKKTQEVLYSTESHTDRSFCRTGVDILPWKSRTQTEENGFQPVEMTVALDIESQPKQEIREV